jgi:hypothetical protein
VEDFVYKNLDTPLFDTSLKKQLTLSGPKAENISLKRSILQMSRTISAAQTFPTTRAVHEQLSVKVFILLHTNIEISSG